MERTAIRSLELEGDERVLEIGSRGGLGIRRLNKTLEWGTVSGVDPSDRNVSDLPWPDDHFDAVVSVNNVMHWPQLREGLAEVQRVLKPEGKVSIAWTGKRPSGTQLDPARTIGDALWHAGFASVRIRRRGRTLYFTAYAQ